MDKGKLSKARRGELYHGVPAGYVLDGTELRKDLDEHVQEAIALVFAKFRELGTARQVARALRAEGVKLPSRHRDERGLEWHETTYSRVWNVLRHPVMGGAYAWGRTRTSMQLDERDQARKSQHKMPMEDWRVLLPEHHEGYVEWGEWLGIQERLAANSFAGDGGGASREGRALLPQDEKGDIKSQEVEFPVDFPLAAPFESGGAKVERLSIREPTVGDVEISDKEKSGLARMVRLMSLVAEVGPGRPAPDGDAGLRPAAGAAGRFSVGAAAIREAQADIAAVFHWPLSELKRLPLREAMAWRSMAVDRALILAGRGVRP